MISYRIATLDDLPILSQISSELFSLPIAGDGPITPEEMYATHKKEMHEGNTAFFLTFADDAVVGFSYVSYRTEYVGGTDGDGTTAYLEGIYVKPPYQGQGIARKLVAMCEDWAREQGCSEFASDCLLDNHDSLAFHLKIGFEESERVILFNKKLK